MVNSQKESEVKTLEENKKLPPDREQEANSPILKFDNLSVDDQMKLLEKYGETAKEATILKVSKSSLSRNL